MDVTCRQVAHTGLESGSVLTTEANGAFIHRGDSPPLIFGTTVALFASLSLGGNRTSLADPLLDS